MKKKVHLICNAHIDPIWQWDWQEGAATAISTFKSAVNLAKDFDYIFCHNEVAVYKYVEEYAPQLFDQIKELVKQGKWHIMGGWYLQPDCTMPSGESFVRQIKTGHEYFKEKFGVVPKTAINFDPFGHTRGLVQIITKCGQDSYLHMRPFKSEMPLDDDQYLWEGFDGSTIKVMRTSGYNSNLGKSIDKIKADIDRFPQPVIASLWGVGNHGGGPSRVDLACISEYIKEAEKEGIEIVHSTPEQFFAEIEPTYKADHSLYISMPGCYVSMSRLKRLHIELENKLYFAEKICSAAELNGLMKYPVQSIKSITEDLLNSEFHDVLPGSCIKSGEENGIRLLSHGILDAERAITSAYFAFLGTEAPAEEGEYPVFVFNPHPYEYDTDIECEFNLADLNKNYETTSRIKVYDSDNNLLVSQITKEESNLNLDWRKRVIFRTKLKPMSLNRFKMMIDFVPKEKTANDDYIVDDGLKRIEIDKKTGLLKSFVYQGKEYIKNAFLPVSFTDNADPWGSGKDQLLRLGTDPKPFELCKQPSGVFGNLKSVEIIENGPIYLGIEAFFEHDNSKVQVKYKIYKKRDYIDVDVNVFWQDIYQLLRVAIPINIPGKLIGQTAFGTDDLFTDARENVSHRFIAVDTGENCLAVFNNCTYGSMFENNTLYISLLRGAAYCAHPVGQRQRIPDNRCIKHIDLCEHTYSFRVAVAKREELERMATEFNQKPFAQNVFPTADAPSDKTLKTIVTDNTDIVLITVKRAVEAEGYVIRLMNNSALPANTKLTVGDSTTDLSFGKYEVKTVIYNNGVFKECKELLI